MIYLVRNKINLQSTSIVFIAVLFLICVSSLSAKGKADSLAPRYSWQSERLSILQKDLDLLFDNPDLNNSFIGVSVVGLESGETLYKRNESKNFIPASTQKMLTTAAALTNLGEDFRFSTYFYLDGNIDKNGEFTGNLIIRGMGDPTISKNFFESPELLFDAWVDSLYSLGIRSIRGNIIGDDNYFDDEYYAPGWALDDIIYPYSAQINALSAYDNHVEIMLEPADSIGLNCKYMLYPENSFVGIINHIITIPDDMYLEVFHERESGSNIIEIRGGIRQNPKKSDTRVISSTIDNPTLFFLNLFKTALERNHLRFRGALLDIDDWASRIDYSALSPAFTHYSPRLAEIIAKLNKTSNNLIAEMLLKTMAKEISGRGTFLEGREQLVKCLSKCGIATEKMFIADGSGLSRMNTISPSSQTQFLSKVFHSDFSRTFVSSLAEPGLEGTLKNRLTKTTAAGKLFAKTGSMTGVSTLSGYIISSETESIAFSIMIMNHSVAPSVVQNLQDLVCMRLASFISYRGK